MMLRKNKIDYPRFLIYLKNIISLLLFIPLKHNFYKSKIKKTNNILFINTGQIGDLVISSLILVNGNLFDENKKVFLLIKKKYSEVFAHYNGSVNIILWDYNRYRFSIFYRIKFIKQLQRLNLEYAVNITTARGPLNDELTVLSGAQKKLCLQTTQNHLVRYFWKYYDKHYSRILYFGKINEFEKLTSILKLITNEAIDRRTNYYIDGNTIKDVFLKIKLNEDDHFLKKVVINPFSNIKEKNWPIENYRQLTRKLSNDNTIIYYEGSQEQKKLIEYIVKDIKNVRNVAGEFTISQSAALISLADLYIGNDSGFTHIAKALNKSLIAIIGCGSYGIFFPYIQGENEYLMYKDVDCKGCEWRCNQEKRFCIEDVDPNQIYELAVKLLNK